MISHFRSTHIRTSLRQLIN
uniref:Uncharacterized protein n=1 Tax=Arundo donax TaxID=35708 RepID=A0A0A8XY00_ARUDO